MSQSRFGWVRGAAAGAVLAAALAGQTARAMSTDGSLLTNIASVSYSSVAANNIGFYISYLVTAPVLVMVPGLALTKSSSPTITSSGNNVSFTIWVQSTSTSSSAFGVVITDKLPDNMTWNSTFNSGSNYFNFSLGNPAWFMAWSTNVGVSWTPGVPTIGQGGPLLLKFTAPVLGPMYSGYISYGALTL